MSQIKVCAPSRIYSAHTCGNFSIGSMIDYMSAMKFDGVDMSFETLSRGDNSYRSIFYAAKQKAISKKLDIPSCHLPFYMPDPSNESKMYDFAQDIKAGIDAAALMQIPLAVIHPIALHKKNASVEKWAVANLRFLTPLRDYAREKGVELLIENMASSCEGEDDHLYGCAAAEILALAEALDVKCCWDFGHANLARRPINEVEMLGGRLALVHAHDNDGETDGHLIPFEGKIDWRSAMKSLSNMRYRGYINIEVRAWHIPKDPIIRADFGRKVLQAGKKLSDMIR